MPQIPDKFIVIGIIQNILTGIEQSATGQKSEKQQGIFTGLFIALRYIYVAIAGREFEGSPRDLIEWMKKYNKNEAEAAGLRQ